MNKEGPPCLVMMCPMLVSHPRSPYTLCPPFRQPSTADGPPAGITICLPSTANDVYKAKLSRETEGSTEGVNERLRPLLVANNHPQQAAISPLCLFLFSLSSSIFATPLPITLHLLFPGPLIKLFHFSSLVPSCI